MNGAVAAGHRLTAEAGARVLAEGGNAVDACVAAAFAAWVTESPLTGPGAGGFALVVPGDGGRPAWPTSSSRPRAGAARRRRPPRCTRSTSASAATATRPRSSPSGEASCAVPGATAGLEALHRAYGRLPWRELLQPAIELAASGLELNRAPGAPARDPRPDPAPLDEGRRLYSKPDGSRLGPGDVLRLPDLGETLERIAAEGASPLYEGDLARATVDTVESGGGLLTLEDLAAYRVVWRRPVQVRYRGLEVVSNPPPSSGGILIAYGLALLERVGSRRGRERRGDRVARGCDARADRAPAKAGSRLRCIAAGLRSACSRPARWRPRRPGSPRHGPRSVEHRPRRRDDPCLGRRRRRQRRFALVLDRFGLGRDRARAREST